VRIVAFRSAKGRSFRGAKGDHSNSPPRWLYPGGARGTAGKNRRARNRGCIPPCPPVILWDWRPEAPSSPGPSSAGGRSDPMSRPALAPVELQLRRVRRRLFVQTLLDRVAWCWAGALLVAVAWFLVQPLLWPDAEEWVRWAVAGGTVALASVLAFVL